jgi:hypothetical protein
MYDNGEKRQVYTTQTYFSEGTALITTATIFVVCSITAFVTVSYYRTRPQQPPDVANEKEVADIAAAPEAVL